MPVSEPIVATEVVPLVQIPPLTPSLNVVVLPEHTVAAPIIAVGVALTFTVVVMLQPPATV